MMVIRWLEDFLFYFLCDWMFCFFIYGEIGIGKIKIIWKFLCDYLFWFDWSIGVMMMFVVVM